MYLLQLKFNTKSIPKEYSDDDDLKKIYRSGEIKYLYKENISGGVSYGLS